ncbi:MAG: 30S ribosomal protein S1 [Bacteroidetes bacterium]|nr:30S ribosomal protein S1 [Bacteroidota bacterium]MDA0944005.1 30S ribosomal protein S1 [Bacteroidota bacterium]MDA1112202.1 30S ribosomal protein S1 [Bacteroidota bacterium]
MVSAPAKAKKADVQVESAHDDFDWDADDAGFQTYSAKEREELESAYTNTFNPVTEKQVVQGKVVAINDKDVVVNIGFKSDGLVPRQEFRDMPDLAVGDDVEVFVDIAEDRLGQLILSRRKALQETAWDKIVEAHESDAIVTGYVRSRTKGGLVVDVFGFDTFLPGSQIDTKPVRDYDQYVNKTMDFKIVKINDVYKNVVVSHKALIEDDIEAQKSEILSKLEKGQVIEGVVKNMTTFGVFVDLGGIDGLLHITDISWGRINHPEEVLKLDEKIQVVILDYDDTKKRISLGLKQLTSHPWDNLAIDISEGSKVKGRVVSVADYGAFVEITPGVEGLVHVSEMSWSSHLRNPSEYLSVGEEIEAVVISLDRDEHKMSLGIKQLTQDPWVEIANRYPVGSQHTGLVKNLTSYGLFLELEEGIDGLVHVSDLSWNKKIKHPSEFTKKGEKMEVVVLEVDKDNRRLSLGHKQLEENPWETFESIFTVGSVHQGTLTSINDKGATVQMQYGVEAFAPTRHLKKEDNSAAKEDEVMDFEVIEFSKDAKRIIVSHTNLWKGAERERVRTEKDGKDKARRNASKAVKKINQTQERSTMGELDALSELRAQLEQAERASAKAAAAKAEKPAAAPNAEKAAEAPKAEKAADSGNGDLKSLSGLGPAMEKRLAEQGVNNIADLTALDEAKIATIVEADSKISADSLNKWIAEAKG